MRRGPLAGREPRALGGLVLARSRRRRALAAAPAPSAQDRRAPAATAGAGGRLEARKGCYLTFHSWIPADHCGGSVTSSRSPLVVTGLNVTLL